MHNPARARCMAPGPVRVLMRGPRRRFRHGGEVVGPGERLSWPEHITALAAVIFPGWSGGAGGARAVFDDGRPRVQDGDPAGLRALVPLSGACSALPRPDSGRRTCWRGMGQALEPCGADPESIVFRAVVQFRFLLDRASKPAGLDPDPIRRPIMRETDAPQARTTPWQGARPHPAHGFTRSHPATSLAHRHAAHTADIIELLLAEHGRLRRLMDAFENAARHCETFGVTWLGSVWERVAEFIEFHMDAEEEICYLAVFRTGQAGPGQMDDAIADHDDIREALLEARLHAVTSPVWWQAVAAALCTCRDQLARFERGPLAEFGRRADPGLRNVLGHQWTSFATARARDDRPGLASRNRSLPHLPVPLPRDAQLPRPQRG